MSDGYGVRRLTCRRRRCRLLSATARLLLLALPFAPPPLFGRLDTGFSHAPDTILCPLLVATSRGIAVLKPLDHIVEKEGRKRPDDAETDGDGEVPGRVRRGVAQPIAYGPVPRDSSVPL